jgi:type I restriction enzyme S subunit
MIGVSTIVVGELMKSGEASLQTGPFGTQLKASDYVEEGVPVINVRNIGHGRLRDEKLEYLNERMADKLDAHRLKRGDIVFGRKGAVDRHLLVDETTEGWIQGSDCLRLRIESRRVFPPFVSFYFDTKGHKDWMDALCSFGATMTSLNQDIVSRITLPFPSYEAQKKIAATLSAYDELMENNRRRIALLEKLGEEIYREWFVRLRFPGHEKVKLVKGVPEGWKQQKLPEITDITYGFAFDGKRFNTDGHGKPIIRIRNIPNSSTQDYSDEQAAEKYLVQSGDLIVGMDGEFHINRWHGPEAFLVQRVCRLRAKSESLEGYLGHAIRGPIKHYESILLGATIGHLGAMHLKTIEILIPPQPLIERLEIFNIIDQQIAALEQSNRQLTNTRDLLLPRLISGKLSVEHLDIQFPPGMAEEKPTGS